MSIATFFVDKRGALLTGFALQVIALGLLMWFVGQLYQLLNGSDPEHPALATTMLAAFVATMTIVAAGTIPSIAIVWSGARGAGPEIAGFAYAIMTISTYAATSTVAAVTILAASLIIWRTQVLPRWLCILGAIEIALNAVELIGLSFQHGLLAGGYAASIGAIVYLVWFAAASICMARRAAPDQPLSEQPSIRSLPLSALSRVTNLRALQSTPPTSDVVQEGVQRGTSQPLVIVRHG